MAMFSLPWHQHLLCQSVQNQDRLVAIEYQVRFIFKIVGSYRVFQYIEIPLYDVLVLAARPQSIASTLRRESSLCLSLKPSHYFKVLVDT